MENSLHPGFILKLRYGSTLTGLPSAIQSADDLELYFPTLRRRCNFIQRVPRYEGGKTIAIKQYIRA